MNIIKHIIVFLVCSRSNTNGVTSGMGTTHPSGALEIAPVLSGVVVCYCDQLHILAIVLSALLRYTDSD